MLSTTHRGDVPSGNLLGAPVTLNALGNYVDVTYQYQVEVGDNDPLIDSANTTGVDLGTSLAVTASVQALIDVIRPSTIVDISADTDVVCTTGTDVILTVTEENDGDATLTSPSVVVDDGSVTIATLTAPPDSGDTLNDGILGAGETWSWDVLVAGLSATTTFTAVGHGTDPFGNDVTWCQDTQNPPADTICDQDESAAVEVTAVDPPVCNITGPTSVCEGDSQVQYCSDVTDADSYL